MKRAYTSPFTSPLQALTRRIANAGDAIEWEEMPSLFGAGAERMAPMDLKAKAPSTAKEASAQAQLEPAEAWGVTMPAELDEPIRVTPFREPMHGLDVREVDEPEVFRAFFK